jgi:dTDP-4-amino-4,6-dideoxygalactose transaminase
VPFADPARAVRNLRTPLDNAISEVLDSGCLILGRSVETFEKEFASWVGTSHAVSVASGTDALELALRALGAAGREVITQANTCLPTVSAIARAAARPVLCDVDPETGTMDADSLAASISPRTAAIIPVHLYGQCPNMDAIIAVARDFGVSVVEDCAHAHGAEWRGRGAGTFGVFGCFSFYPTKNLGALGDGGAITTDDPELAERLQCIRQYGRLGGDDALDLGVNSRLDEVQAAILRVKLQHLCRWNSRRTSLAEMYDNALAGSAVKPLRRLAAARHAFHLYVVRAPDRAGFRRALARAGVETLVHYPRPVHGYRHYADLVTAPVSLATSERLAEEVVSIPLYPELEEYELAHVVQVLGAVAAG